MRLGEMKRLVESTSDCAFVVDNLGLVVAWNKAAEEVFGITSEEAIGTPCGQILQGTDGCGPVCSLDCSVRQAVKNHHPLKNMDFQVSTRHGKQWCNVSVLTAEGSFAVSPYAIHILRPIDLRKRLELALRDFIVTGTNLPAEEVLTLISYARAPAQGTQLSEREKEVLRLLARGATTAGIAGQLCISRTTVNNHIQHILRKLGAHSRLEAIRRAELAGLI